MAIRICLDAGHGGKDSGATNLSLYESHGTLQVVNWIKNLLLDSCTKEQYLIELTRKDDTYVGLTERCTISNNFKADAFISIHFNSAENKTASGIETLRYPTVGSTTKRLANNVQTCLIDSLKWKNRGVKERSNLTVLKKTVAPAILVECGFISHAEESKLLFDCHTQYKIAKAIVKSIEQTFA